MENTIAADARAGNAGLRDEFDLAMFGQVAEAIRPALRSRGLRFTAELACGGLGGARGRTHGRLWHPDPGAPMMAVLPVYSGEIPSIYCLVDAPDLIDIIAWRPGVPGRWWLRRGDAPAFLGVGAVDHALTWGEPLHLYTTPESWLFAGGAGAVVLDWTQARHNLINAREIVAETVALGEAVDRKMREPVAPLPKISVPRQAVAA